jgi:RTX calcium-binding nonapeptide repeat (4 copies)
MRLPTDVAALCCLLLLAGSVTSTSAGSGVSTTTGTSVGVSHGEVQILASNRSNKIHVTRARRGELRIEDARGAVEATSGCVQVGPRKVRCPTERWIHYSANGGGDAVIFSLAADSHAVALGSGGTGTGFSDHLEIAAGSRARAGFTGYQGKDALIGASGRLDSLFGGRGDDRLVGRERTDRLVGHKGADALFGGPGNDRLVADDGGRDRIIRCGPGKDLAILDARRLDPKPRSCERVKFRSHGRPSPPRDPRSTQNR